MAIGNNIKKIRKRKGMTQKELGSKCGIADSAIRRYELGGANPKRETLQKIADALDVSIYILTDEFKSLSAPHIGKQIRKYREEAGLHQHELAKYLEVTQQTIATWEIGRNTPSTDKILKMCQILNISLNDMYGVYSVPDEKLSSEEKQYLEKYRIISQYSPDGIDAVNYILNREYKIARQIKENKLTTP